MKKGDELNQELHRRIEDGRTIAQTKRLRRTEAGMWKVPSQSGRHESYTVDLHRRTCTCPDFEAHGIDCKHIYAARFATHPSSITAVPETKIMKPSYSQNWKAYDHAQTHEREMFELLLRDLCRGIQEPEQTSGRKRVPLRDMVYAAATKVYSGMSGRRASTDVRRAKEQDFISKAPHHSTISNALKSRALTPVLQALITESAKPLSVVETQFAIDATGFSTLTYGRWLDSKTTARRKEWMKCHALVGTVTNIVAAVRITPSNVADTVMLPDLVSDTAKHFNMKELSADKGYLSAQNLLTAESFGVDPYIPFKVDSKGDNGPFIWKRLFHLFHFRYDEFARHYHRRSNVETTFYMIKSKFGSRLRSKKDTSRINEALLKVLCHNIVVLIHELTEANINPVTFHWKRSRNGAAFRSRSTRSFFDVSRPARSVGGRYAGRSGYSGCRWVGPWMRMSSPLWMRRSAMALAAAAL